jgi:hypothetical protein
MASFLIALVQNGRDANGIGGAIANGADAAAARTAANAMRTHGSDPDFTDANKFSASQINSTDSAFQCLIEGKPLYPVAAAGSPRRRGA